MRTKPRQARERQREHEEARLPNQAARTTGGAASKPQCAPILDASRAKAVAVTAIKAMKDALKGSQAKGAMNSNALGGYMNGRSAISPRIGRCSLGDGREIVDRRRVGPGEPRRRPTAEPNRPPRQTRLPR